MLTLRPNSIGIYRGEFRPQNCSVRTVSRTHPVFRDLYRTIRVNPITLGTNDHHGHLEGSLGYPWPLTLPQNSNGNLRGDVRPDLCQSSLFRIPAGSVCAIQVCLTKNSPNTTQQRSNLTFYSLIPHPETSMREIIRNETGKPRETLFGQSDLSALSHGVMAESFMSLFGFHETSSSRFKSVLGFCVICNLRYHRNLA
ncbi:hypothetical protein CRG98_017342 [Punica granatum]|uniref:Uncharacterized protein n=1 Tax=Punica granatum TaxID=22663 RepID=A0A2I0K135_PUNGR|nr:hypothetical protein CRG98_017342 [Punica granatum]